MSRVKIENVYNLRAEIDGQFEQGDLTIPFKLVADMGLPDAAHGTFEQEGELREFLRLDEQDYIAWPGYSFFEGVGLN